MQTPGELARANFSCTQHNPKRMEAATAGTGSGLPKVTYAIIAEEQEVVNNFILGTDALQWKNLDYLRGYKPDNDEKYYGVRQLTSMTTDRRAYDLGYRFVARTSTGSLGYFHLATRAAIEVFDEDATLANKIVAANERCAVMTVDEATALLKVDGLELEMSPVGTHKTGYVGVYENYHTTASGRKRIFKAFDYETYISQRICPVRAAVDRARYIGLQTERDVNPWPSLPVEDKRRLRAEARADVLDVVMSADGTILAIGAPDGVRPQRKAAKVATNGFKALKDSRSRRSF